MTILAIILGLLALGCGIAWTGTKNEPFAWGFLLFGLLWVFAFVLSFRLSFGEQSLTGYIYSSNSKFGYTTAHIRFSEQAGMDAQPSFCVKEDSEPGRQIKELTGSGQKVLVEIPPYFYFINNPFACGTTEMTITEVE